MKHRGFIWGVLLISCAVFWYVVFYAFLSHAQPAPTPVTGSASVSDAAYDESTWNGDTTNAPSKNAMRDKIEALSVGGNVTINTTSPLTGAGTGSSFTLGFTPSLLMLQDVGGAVTDAQVPNNITITGLSGTNTGDQDISGKQNISSLETDVESLVDLQDLQGAVTDAQVPNNITVDLATAASALASNPTACGAGDFVSDMAADGTLTCGTPSGGGGGVGIGTVNPGTTNAIAKYVSSTTLDDSSVLFENNGNVGIGTNTPLAGTKFEVVGPSSSNGDDYIALFRESGVTPEISGLTTSGATGRAVSVQGSGGAYYMGRDVTNDIEFIMGTSTTGVAFAGTLTAHDFQLRTNNAIKMSVVNSSGNVGVGTTNPNGRFTVFGSSTGAVPIQTWKDSGNTQRMVVMGNGTVGIGTAAPGNALDVSGTMSATTVTGANVTSGANPGHTHTTTSISGIDISDDTNLAGTTDEVVLTGDTLSLDSKRKGWTDGGTNVYTSTTTDTVGIGTTTPKSGFEFDLRGDQYVSGNVGIGTATVPDVPLYVGGNGIKASQIQGTSAPGTPFTITLTNIGIGTIAAGASVVICNSPSHTNTNFCIGTAGCMGYCTGALGTCSACNCFTCQ